MESKNYYILIVLFFVPFFSYGQDSQDTTKTVLKETQTAKGVSTYEGLPFEETPVPIIPKVIAKSQPPLQEKQTTIKALSIDDQTVNREMTPIDELQKILENDIADIDRKLTTIGLKYREERILKIKKEEAQYDLSFLKRIEGIKETIAYETTGNSEAFVIAADQFLDTLYNEDTEVSERFKELSQERYDNYLAKDKIIKLKINDVKVEKINRVGSSEKIYKYSGFAILFRFGKKVRVEFFSDTFVRKADRKLMYEVAKEDDMEQSVIIEGVISEYKHGRKNTSTKNVEMPLSNISIQDWIIIDREQLIQEFKNK